MEVRKLYLSEIQKMLNIELIGNDIEINGLAFDLEKIPINSKILTFCSDILFLRISEALTYIKAIITTKETFEKRKNLNVAYFIADDPQSKFYELHEFLVNNTIFYNEHDFKKIIGKNTKIHETAIIEDGVIIGDNVKIYPYAIIRKGSIIGNNVSIKSNTVIGENGFQVKKVNDRIKVIQHAGGVKIGENVEIGSNCGVDKALFEGYTTINKNTKIDNLVQIAHNCIIGENCIICADSQMSGATTIGKNTYIAPSVSIRNQLNIGENVFIGQGSVVTKSIPSRQKWYGVPAKYMSENNLSKY